MKHILRVILLTTLSLAIFTVSAQSEYYDDSGAASTRNPYYIPESGNYLKGIDKILARGFKDKVEQAGLVPNFLSDITGGSVSKYDSEIPGIYGSIMSGEDINDLRKQVRKANAKATLEKILYLVLILSVCVSIIYMICKSIISESQTQQQGNNTAPKSQEGNERNETTSSRLENTSTTNEINCSSNDLVNNKIEPLDRDQSTHHDDLILGNKKEASEKGKIKDVTFFDISNTCSKQIAHDTKISQKTMSDFSTMRDTETNTIRHIANLIENKINIVSKVHLHKIEQDNRLLIPILKYNRFGLINRAYEIVLPPEYAIIRGECLDDDDILIIGKYNVKVFGDIKNPKIYTHMVLGAVDSTGKIILDVDYWTIIISDDRQRFTVVDYKTRKHGVLDRKGNIIVPFGEYAYIDGFDHGLARVKKDNRWGLINNNGDVVLQTEYDRIWSFHGKNRTSTKVIKGNSEWDVSFSSLIMGYTTIVDDTTAD